MLCELGLDGGAGGAVASHAGDGSERPLAEQLAVVVHLTMWGYKDQAGKRYVRVGPDKQQCLALALALALAVGG